MKFRFTLATVFVAAFAFEVSAADKTAKPAAAPAPEAQPASAAAKLDLKDPVAVVDGTEVKAAELETAINSVLGQQGATMEQVPADKKNELYRQVLDGVIVEKLVTKASSQTQVTDADVKQEFDRFSKQFPNEEEMKSQLAKAGKTQESVKGDIRRFLQQNRWLDEQLKGKAEVSEAEAHEFYKANTEQFKTPEEVRASHILVKCEKDAKDEEVKTKREAANKILDRVKKGEDFDKLASEMSEDPSAKENHGDLNFFKREQMVPEFSKAAFEMKKGDVSDTPVRSEFGFHIIKVTDRKVAGSMTFEDAKPRLLVFLQEQKRRTEAGKVLRGLRETAKVTVNLPEAK